MHAAIGEGVLIDTDNDNVLIYDNETIDPMKYDNGGYCGVENYVDVD